MKFKLIIALVVAFLSLSSSVFAQEKSFGFESEDGWSTKSEKNWSVTNEKGTEGANSLKFSCNEHLVDVKNIQMYRVRETIQPGTYTVTAKVWIEEDSEVVGFSLNFQKPWTSVPFKFKKTQKEQWVELTSELVVDEPSKKMALAVSTNPRWGGQGTFYVDAITFTRKLDPAF